MKKLEAARDCRGGKLPILEISMPGVFTEIENDAIMTMELK